VPQKKFLGFLRWVLPAASGHVAAAPPSSDMNSRRFIRSPRRRRPAEPATRATRVPSPFSDEPYKPVRTLLHEVGHALDNTSGQQLSKTFGARLFRIFEFLEVEIGAHFRSDSERFAEAYAMALSPSGHDFFHRDISHGLKQLLAPVLQEIRVLRV
jgi:hypothetical protein